MHPCDFAATGGFDHGLLWMAHDHCLIRYGYPGDPTLTYLSTGSVQLPQAFADSQHFLVSMANLAPTDDWVACMEAGGFGHRHARSTSEMPAASERPPFELLSLQFGVICSETLPCHGED